MANAYASTTDLQQRWRTLSDDERNRAEVLLGDAAAYIRAEFKAKGKVLDEPALKEELCIVSCDIVKRALNSPETEYSSYSATAGSFSEQFSFSNSDGELFMKKSERKLLGLAPSGRMGNFNLTGV